MALDRIARKAAGLSGASLKALADWVNNAAMAKTLGGAQDSAISTALFDEGLKIFGPTVPGWLAQARMELKPKGRLAAFRPLFAPLSQG